MGGGSENDHRWLRNARFMWLSKTSKGWGVPRKKFCRKEWGGVPLIITQDTRRKIVGTLVGRMGDLYPWDLEERRPRPKK